MPYVAIGHPVIGEGEAPGVGLLQARDDQPQNRIQDQEGQHRDQRQPQQHAGVETLQSGGNAGKMDCSTVDRVVSHVCYPAATYTPNVSRHCLMTSGTPLVISATVGLIIFKSLADLAPSEGETSGLIDSVKCSTQIREAPSLIRNSMNRRAALGCLLPFMMLEGAMIKTLPSVGYTMASGLPFCTLSSSVPTGPDPATALSPAFSMVTVSLIERPTRGLFLASFSKKSQPYCLRSVSAQVPT